MISIIVAVGEDMGIGKDNGLLWHISEDLKRFKRLTYGKTVIMGKKTWESLPLKPLPGRRNIVLTDIPEECIDCTITAYSVNDALAKCANDEEIFVIGGGMVYRQFLPLADRLYITHVSKRADADVFFPRIDRRIWKITAKEDFRTEDGSLEYSYVVYERKRSGRDKEQR
jgi:dihydrofolate reductase